MSAQLISDRAFFRSEQSYDEWRDGRARLKDERVLAELCGPMGRDMPKPSMGINRKPLPFWRSAA